MFNEWRELIDVRLELSLAIYNIKTSELNSDASLKIYESNPKFCLIPHTQCMIYNIQNLLMYSVILLDNTRIKHVICYSKFINLIRSFAWHYTHKTWYILFKIYIFTSKFCLIPHTRHIVYYFCCKQRLLINALPNNT